jgi:hypothetical protein
MIMMVVIIGVRPMVAERACHQVKLYSGANAFLFCCRVGGFGRFLDCTYWGSYPHEQAQGCTASWDPAMWCEITGYNEQYIYGPQFCDEPFDEVGMVILPTSDWAVNPAVCPYGISCEELEWPPLPEPGEVEDRAGARLAYIMNIFRVKKMRAELSRIELQEYVFGHYTAMIFNRGAFLEGVGLLQ